MQRFTMVILLIAMYVCAQNQDQRLDLLEKEIEKLKMSAVAPVGIVVAFAGSKKNIPKGWMLCDGSKLNIDEYEDLYNAIGSSYGDEVDTEKKTRGYFYLPDYRGYFLRGVDHETNRDPDVQSRSAQRNKNDKGQVGSVQNDMLKNHEHGYNTGSLVQILGGHLDQASIHWRTNDGGGHSWWAKAVHVDLKSFGGSETRPKKRLC